MLQPDKSAKRVIAESYNRQFEEMSNVEKALLEAKIKFSDQTAQIQNVYSQDQLDNFTREGLSPSLYADMDKLLGQSQSGFDRGFNVFARGLAKAPAAFLEPIGYGVDYIANNVFGEVAEGDEDFTNSFNEWLKEYEKSVDDAFPVFTGDIEDEPSVFQAGWWVKNGDQIIRSLGYYPYGMVAGRVLGAGVTGLLTRGAATNASVQTSAQIANQARNIERISRGTSAIGTGVTQNYAEHMHSAASVFQENYKEYKLIFAEQDPQATEEEIDLKARIKAGHDASNVVKMGRWNLLFEIPTNYMLFRSPATTRSLQGIAGGGRRATMQRAGMAVFEPTQEAGEEVWTGFLEKEGRRQVGLEKGYYKQDYTTMFDRWANHALSYEGYTEGLSGAIGGGIFTGYSLAFADNKARKVQLEQEKVNAAFANDMAKYRNLNEQSLFETFRSNAQKGTYESMIKHFEDIANLTPEQANDRGLDEDYKEKAQKVIKKALDYEADYNANIFTYKDPVKAEILTRSKYVQNYLNGLIEENEGKLAEAKSESASYINAQGLPAEMVNVFDATSKIEALRASVDKITSDINEATAAIKNNKERTLDKGETAADMQNRLDVVQKQLDEAILSQEEAINILKDTSGLTDEQITSALVKAFKPGTPLYNQAVAEESVIDAKSRYATEVDRYSNFLEDPDALNNEAKNIRSKADKIEKARKENIKKQKAEEKAEKQKTRVNAKKQQNVSDKVEGEGSTKENIKNKETSKATLDEILDQSQEAPAEVKLEAEASINDQLDKILEGDVESMRAYQMMLEGQLSEEQLARLQDGIQAKENNKEVAKQINAEQTANTVEVANASSDNKSIGESAAGDRQVKNFNYDKNKDGSIPFERQDSTTEEQDKKQLTRETKNSLTNKPDSRIKIATKQIIDGANAIAYLAVDYVSKLINTPEGTKFIRQTASKDKTKTLVPEIESPNHLGPGTAITLRTVKEGSKGLRYIYDEQGMPKEVTWKYSDFIKPGGQINSEQIPIEIVAQVQGQEKVIGYVHDTDWIDAALVTGQPRNVVREIKDIKESFDNWSYQKAEIRALRKDIIDKGGEVTTTISEVSTGTPFLNVIVDEQGNPTGETEWQDVKALMPDFKNLRLSFRQVGNWVTNPNKPVKEFISNNDKEYSDGRIALVLPTKKKDEVFVAPLWTKPLNNEQIETIINASTALEDSEISKKISNDLGFNFSKSNPAALSTLINRTVYTQRFEFDPSKPSETVYIDANPNNNMIMIATEGNRVIYTNKPDAVPKNLVETKSSIQPIAGNEPAVRKILQTLLPSINIKKANTDGQYVNAIISSNEKGVQYDSKKYDNYNSYAFDLVQTNINGTNSFTGADGQQEYVYVNQPVIQFSKDFTAKKESVKPNQVMSITEIEDYLKGKLPKLINRDVMGAAKPGNFEFIANKIFTLATVEEQFLGSTLAKIADLGAYPSKKMLFNDIIKAIYNLTNENTAEKIELVAREFLKEEELYVDPKGEIRSLVDDKQFSTLLREKESPKSNQVINIYAGTGENVELSNFAERPFTYNGVKFKTVEHAFQYAKKKYYNLYSIDPASNVTPQDLQKKLDARFDKILNAKTPAEARKLGKARIGIDFENKFWDQESSKVMKDLIKDSFEQNPDALQKLLNTGDATLTHTQDKSKWGKLFPKILMEVREELREKDSKKPNKLGSLFQDLIDDADYSIDFSIEPVAGQPELPFEETEKFYNRLDPFFIDFNSIDYSRQKQILDFTTYFVTKSFINNPDISVNESIEAARQVFVSAKNNEDFENKSDVIKRDIDTILQNWEKVTALTKEQLNSVHNIKEGKSRDKKDLEKDSFKDEARWQSNPKKKASARMKTKLSAILRRNSKGEPVLNYLEQPTFYSFDEVWGNLKGILTESLPNIDSMLEQMDAKGAINPMFKEIARYIRSDRFSEQERSEFVAEFANAYIAQKMTIFSKDNAGNFSGEIIDSAANKESSTVRDRWLIQQFENPNLVKFSKDGEAYIDSEYAKKVETDYKEEFNKIKDSYKGRRENMLQSDELAQLLHNTLTKLSIVVPVEAFEHLATPIERSNKTIGDDILGQAWGYAVDPRSPKGFMTRIFKGYTTNVPKLEDIKYDPEVQENAKPLFANNALKGSNFQAVVLKLAELTAKFGDPIYAISYRDGEGKAVYPYNGTTSMHVLLKLYENYDNDVVAKNLVDNIKATHMGSVSRLLDDITQEKGALKINYTDALKDKYGNESRAAKRKYQGILQQNINSMWLFQNQNKSVGYFFGVTKADRGVSELIEHRKVDFKDQIKIEDNKVVGIFKTAEDYLYSYALGEVKRIYDTQNKLDSDPTYLQDDKKYREGSQYFHFFSFLNKHELEKSFTEEEVNTVYPAESFDGIPKIDIVAAEPILRKAINEFATSIINESIAEFTELNLTDKFDKSYMASLGKDTNAETKTAMAIGDLELNYIISNIEQQILFGGDIAEAYTSKGATAADKIQSGRSNNQKRLIGTDAPKIQGNYKKREYTAITLNDRLSYSNSYKYYDKLFGTGSPYGSPTNKIIESTDALELTTVQEHIDMLNFFGQIEKEVYDSISNKIDNAIKDESNTNNYYELTEEEMAFALRPVKPQYDFMHPDPKTGRLSRVYRKSMSIPLLPDMTSDFQLDNLRIAMEITGVARAGHKTSDKLSPYKSIDAYDANGDILSVDQLISNIEDNGIFTLYRDGLGIQQEKNVKPQQLIALSTQKSKVMFAGLLEEKFKVNGKEILGEDLRKTKEEIISLIYKIKHDKVLKRFGNIQTEEGKEILAVDGTEVQLKELVSALKQEAEARNWNINDIFSLELKEDGSGTLIPLPFIQSRRMLEGLMLSVVNKIADIKIPGITYVQSSSAGFKSTAAWSEVEGSMRNQVITTTSFDETKGLQGPRWDDKKGEAIPGQIMVKFFYKDEDGNELDIMDKDSSGNYIFLFEKNGRLFLNPNTVPKEVRQMIGYRIPYQNLASEMPLEIVGFLPKNMEITAIVPDEMLPQMGSDFDVDTLNSIIAQYIVTKDTNNNIKGVYRRDRVKNPNKFTDEMRLLDGLRDIFWSITTTNKKAFDKMSKGIDDPALENIAEDVDKILNANVRPRTAISRVDQIRDNISQRAGQVLIGPGAQANTLNAIFEGKNIHLATLKKSGKKTTIKNFEILGLFTEETYASGPRKGQYKPLRFSDLSGENKSVYYKKGKKFFRTSSDVINIKLNAAIDNANKPTLGKLNFTMDTLPTSLFMDMGGVPIEISGYMMPQEIMRDYTKELDKIVQGLSDKNVFERKSEAEKIIMEKYQKLAKLEDINEVEAIVQEYSDQTNENFEVLFQSKTLRKELIIGAPNSGIEKDAKYYQKQIAIFKKFKKFEAFSDTLNKPRKAINDPSVRGLQSTIASAKSYIKRFNDVFNMGEMDFVKGVNTLNSGITGLKSLANTEYANLAKYLESGFTLFNNVYPTDTPFIRDIEETFINNTGSTEVNETVAGLLYDGIISNGWSYALEQVFIKERKEANSLYELRRKLFVEDNNIAVQTSEAQKTEWGKTNEFVMALTPYYSTNKNKGKAAVGMDWSSNIDNIAMQRGFTALFLGNAEAQEFAKNLLIAAYLNGGNQKASSYLNMIPFGALENLGLTKELSDNMFREEGITSVMSYLTQVIQHNPWYATEINIKDKKIRKHVTVQEDNKVITGLVLPNIDEAKDLPALENFMYLADGKAYYKNFLTYPVGKTYYLFTLESSVDKGIYFKRIDLKGDKFGTEYDHTGNTFSYLEDNKVIKTVKDPIPDGVPPVGVPWHEVPIEAYEDTPGMTVTDPIEDYNNRKDNYDNQLDALMDTIINDGEEGAAELARLFKAKGIYKSLPFKGVEVLDKIRRTNRGIILGSYSNPTQKIEIYQGSLDLVKATPSRVAKTMLHEATHYFTNPALKGEDTSPAAKRFKRSMEALLEKAKKEFESSEEYQKARTQREKDRKKRIAYGLSNVVELMAGMVENKHLQEFLNNIPYQKDSTLFEKIKNTVKKYFLALGKQLGFDIKEGSALDVGISEMLMFLQIQDETVQDPIPEPRTPEKDTGELAGIIGGATMVLDSKGMPTGEVIVNGPQATPTDKLQDAKFKGVAEVAEFESVLAVAMSRLAGYRQLQSKGTTQEIAEAFKKKYNGDIEAFKKDVEQEIIETGQADFSIVSDTMDMPVNAQGEIAEVVQSINGRIKALQRRKTLATSVEKRIYLDSQIDSLKDDIEKLKEGNNTYVIEDVALRQLDWAKNILERPRLSLQEMADASRMIDIWSFKNTKHLLSEDQAKDKDNPTRKTFEDIGNIASSVELTMAAKMKEWVKNYVEQVSGEPLTDESMSAFLDMQDEGWFRGYFIDPSGFVNPVARAADGALKTVARNAEDSTLNEVTDIQKKFKDLREELSKLNISEDIFLQKDKDGNKTGYFASKFNESYYKDLTKVHSTHKKELERIVGSTRLTVDQIRQERFESFKKLYDTKNSMEEVIDIRFWIKDDHKAGKLKSKEQYIQYLNDTFGESVAQDLIGQAENSLSRYNLEELAHRRKVATDLSEGVIKPAIGLTLQETAEAIHKRWVNKNNPELYLNQRLNTTAINIGYGTAGWKYTITYPRPERTEYFNKEFSIIENNDVLSDFYLFWTDSMARYKSYLPEVAVNEMSENFFPTIQKDLLEEYMNRGAIAALSYLAKDTKLYGALFADETLTLNRESEGLKAELDERGVPVSKVPLRFLGSEDVEIEDRAFDMERVMVMFAGMAMNYKFKSEAEPLIDILMRTVREATKPYLDSRGKKFKRWGSDKNITIKSGPQVIQEALDYAQQSIMYGRSREKISKTSLEMPGNFSKDILSRKRRAEELKKQYDELNDKLVDGTITKAQFNTAAEALEAEFKELNIKAFSFNKLIRGFVSYTQLKGLGWNLSAGIANVGFGMLASSIHAAGEEDYTSKELGKALRIVMASAVNPSASKASAIMKRMNLLFEMREITYGSPAARGDKKFKMLGKLSPMYIQQSTEFIVQGMSAIAKMLNTTVVDLQGNERNLYEAFNKDATWNVEEFGYQKEWDFNNLEATTRNSYTKFRDAAIEMNKKLHGNYDPNSLVKVKSKDFNLLFTIFRTWAFEGFNTRYSKKVWNDQLGRYTKGRYNSIFDVGIVNSSKIMMKLLLKRVTRQSTDSIMSGVEDNLDAINLRKTFAAMKAQITIMALGLMLKGLADDTDDEEALSDPALKALLNILFRVEQDLSYYRNPATFISVFKDPSPALKTITDVTRAFDGTQRYILKDDYRGDHPMYKWGKVFPLTNQIYKWTVITEKDLDTSYGLSDYIEDEYFKDED